MRQRRLIGFLLLLGACGPRTVEDAERRGKVEWLAQQPSVAAVAALGRLADTNAEARAALERKADDGSMSTFVAAWEATRRGAAWGESLLKRALAQASTADKAALVMTRGDAHLAGFVGDLSAALAHDAARGLPLAALLASVGDGAAKAIDDRLRDPRTRATMCQAIATKDASPAARKALLVGPASARDAAACMDVVVRLALEDDDVLAWMGQEGEPALLKEAADGSLFSCARLKKAWVTAFASRPADDATALSLPLRAALRRCPLELDGEVSRSLRRQPAFRYGVVSAIDPQIALGVTMPLTCIELGTIAHSRDALAIVRDKAQDASNGCRGR